MLSLHTRSYQSPADLTAIGALLRQVYQIDPYWNGWSIARFDIWAQRALADALFFGKSDWQNDFCLWEDPSGQLAAAAFFFSGPFAVLVFSPAQTPLIPEMLNWVETHGHGKITPEKPIFIEALESNRSLTAALRARGYVQDSDWMFFRERALDPQILDAVHLPEGYTLKVLETESELKQRFDAIHAVFNFIDTPAAHASICRASSYRADLDLIVLGGGGEVAAFATVWVDDNCNYAEFEPVGTRAEHRQRGLSLAMMNEACNRLRRHGLTRVLVNSWSESPAANALYDRAGLGKVDRLFGWSLPHNR